jgi:restriction system protein
MSVGDLVVYPSQQDRLIHIGLVEGSYQYDATTELSYPQVRAVKWLTSVPRTKLTQGALYEIGSALSFFQIKHYASEFSAAAEGKVTVLPVTQDESVAAVSEEILESTRDFILKRLAQELKGHCFRESNVLGNCLVLVASYAAPSTHIPLRDVNLRWPMHEPDRQKRR